LIKLAVFCQFLSDVHGIVSHTEADLGMFTQHVRPNRGPHKNGAPTRGPKKLVFLYDCICTDRTYALLNTVICCVAFEKIDYKIRIVQ